ncbi:MAG: high-affinity branched-chain amino acid ABC transporter ATP-binding protein LivG [Thermoleophilia bacterium]
MALLRVESLTRRFGGIVALNDVTLDVPARHIVGLIGPNGAGKTTLFNLVTRLYRPDRGRIFFGGQDLLRIPAHRLARLGIGRTFQSVELSARMSVLENVLVGFHTRSPWTREREARQAALAALDYVGLTDLAERPARGLPFATLKRIELARALVSGPKLLLLDEPAAGLTHEEVEKLARFVRRLRDDFDLTIFLVEHHMNLVMGISEIVHVLDFGQLIATGTPEEVRSSPAVIEAYLGREEESGAP